MEKFGVQRKPLWRSISVSWGCCNKSPRTEQFKRPTICSFTILEARNLKSRFWQGCSLCSLLCSTSLALPWVLFFSSSYGDTGHWIQGSPAQHDLILTTPAKTLFKLRVPGRHEFRRHTIQPTTRRESELRFTRKTCICLARGPRNTSLENSKGLKM